jgi:Fur family iron response transcriptional regulator
MHNNNNYIEKLRRSGLRPTKQRIKICEALFNNESTFHFTISDLTKIISEKINERISLATVYNTVHAFKEKGYLKEITINSDKSYFDTNTSEHHHFFDEDTNQLIDAKSHEIDSIKINKNLSNKKIKSVEVFIRIATDNQSHN